MREMLLDGTEQLLIGCACELRPALAVSDPLVAFDYRRAVAGRHLWMCPAEAVRVGPIHVVNDR
jgi:hypothetical protein